MSTTPRSTGASTENGRSAAGRVTASGASPFTAGHGITSQTSPIWSGASPKREVDNRERIATNRDNKYLRQWAKGQRPLLWKDLGPLPVVVDKVRIRLDAVTADDIEDAARELETAAKQTYDEVVMLAAAMRDLARSARRGGNEDQEQHESDEVEHQAERSDHAAEAEPLQERKIAATMATHESQRGRIALRIASSPKSATIASTKTIPAAQACRSHAGTSSATREGPGASPRA